MQKLYIIVKDGMAQEIYSTMNSNEVSVEVLDLDGQVSKEQNKERNFRYQAIRELMYRVD